MQKVENIRLISGIEKKGEDRNTHVYASIKLMESFFLFTPKGATVDSFELSG